MKDLTKGKPRNTLLAFALPFILATFLQAFFNISDVIFLGIFSGEKEAAAAGISGQILYLFLNFILGFSAGATLVIGRYFGENKKEKIAGFIRPLGVILALFCLLFCGVLAGFSKQILGVSGAPPDVTDTAARFIRLSAIGFPFAFFYTALAAVFRGLGDAKTPLWLILIAAGGNVIFNFVFIVFLKIGAAGAAVSTDLSYLSAALAAFVFWRKKRGIRLKKAKETEKRKRRENVGELLKKGLPLAFLNLAASLSFMGLTVLVNVLFDKSAVNAQANAAALRFNGFAVLPCRAMAGAISVFVAQNAGGGKAERIKPAFLWGAGITIVYGALLFMPVFFFPDWVCTLAGIRGAAKSAGRGYLKAMSFDNIFLPLGTCAAGLVEGKGKTAVSMAVYAVASLGIRLPFAYLSGKLWGMTGIGLSLPIASLAAAAGIWGYILVQNIKARKKRFSNVFS